MLMGDFNYTYMGSCNSHIAQLFREKLGLNQLVDSVTTDYGSCLDHIYTNMTRMQLKGFGTLESYYSDHKPLFLAFKPELSLDSDL